jgi:hypothetical protein
MDGRHHILSILASSDEKALGYHPMIAAAYHGRGNAPRPIAEANARLIASAPELLEALRLCIETFEHLPEKVGGVSSGAAVRKAFAVIAKATGSEVGK